MKIVAAAAVCLLSGCFIATQDNPIGTLDGGRDGGGDPSPRKPNVMLLVDKSGSMSFPANAQDAACTPGCNTPGNPPCPAACRTRLQELKSAMSGFFANNATVAWLGLAIFPTSVVGSSGIVDACGATTAADILVPLEPLKTDLPADMMAAATRVDTKIQALTVGGGTPTSGSLRFLGTYAALADPDPTVIREDFVLLITDGLPNCNQSNANNCNDVAACKCTLTPATSCMPASFCTQGCLDKDSSTAQVTELRKKNIRTIVIGFGSETATGDGPATLDAMAMAGGFARSCPGGANTECGAGNTCEVATRLCNRKYYQASTSLELQAVLSELFKTAPTP